MSCFEQALKLQPRFAEASFNLGLQLHNRKRFEEALEHYDAALSIRPDYCEALTHRA